MYTLLITPEQTRKILADIKQIYLLDMLNYNTQFAQKAITKMMRTQKIDDFDEFYRFVMVDESRIKEMFGYFFINVSWMFRDPEVFKMIREKVIPALDSYARIKIWCAGCATGEEAYSIAIILDELGLLDRTTIYATDIDTQALHVARTRRYSATHMLACTQNYYLSGGVKPFKNYYKVHNNEVILNERLANNICFAEHNLITDSSFNEFQLILCRNMFIYFNDDLQKHALQTFDKSLENGGFFISGYHERIHRNDLKKSFKLYSKLHRIYRKSY